jgi:hypothetical protein
MVIIKEIDSYKIRNYNEWVNCNKDVIMSAEIRLMLAPNTDKKSDNLKQHVRDHIRVVDTYDNISNYCKAQRGKVFENYKCIDSTFYITGVQLSIEKCRRIWK